MEKQEARRCINQRIGRTVKALLRARGLTARQLGDAIGEPETTVSKLTKGRQSWQADTLQDAAKALDVEIAVLYLDAQQALEMVGLAPEAASALLRNTGLLTASSGCTTDNASRRGSQKRVARNRGDDAATFSARAGHGNANRRVTANPEEVAA